MIFLRSYISRVLIAVCLFGLSFTVTSNAQTPINPTVWLGSPASAAGPSGFTTLPATITPGVGTVAISQWDRAAVVVNAAGGCYNSNNWQVAGSLAAAQAANKCIFFTVTNSATTELQVTRLYIRSQVSATGPQNVQVTYTIGSVTGTFGPVIATAHSASPENWDLTGNICIGPGQTATFRLYGWGATGSAGTLRINDNTSITAGFTTPVTGTASSNSPICSGTDLYLTGTATGGIPGYTYSWSGPGGFSSAILSPTVTAVPASASGVYTLTITDALNCSTSAVPVTTTVTVNTAPAPITGTLTVCPLLTTTLTSTSPAGTWSSSDASIATVTPSGGVVTGVAPGTVTISYQLSSSCVTTAVVTVATPPSAISGVLSVCTGFTTALSSTPTGGTWLSSNTTVATVSGTGTVSGLVVGTSNITYTATTGCITVAMVTVYPLPIASTGTPTVCVGATTTLSNVSSGGTWGSSNTSVATVGLTTGVVTGIAAGTANITYTLGGGCYVITAVTVHPLPDVITGTLEVCVASSVGLSNSSGGGTWSSSNTGIATAASLTGIITGVAAGTATITYTLPTGCYSTAVITVNPLPAAITGPTGVCLGTTVTLNSTTPGGQWYSDNTPVAPIGLSIGIVSGSSVGTALISYIVTATGCMITRVQTVHPLPTTITGPSVVCPGLSITLSSTPSGGTWSSSDITRAIAAAGGIITGVAAGTVTITYTLPTTCITTKAITVNPAPPAIITPLGDTTFCPGGFVVLLANSGTSLTYQWLVGASPVPGATSDIYTATTTGSVRVRVTNGFGCPFTSAPVSILVNSVTATLTVPAGSTTACATSPVVLNASPTGSGYSYDWLFNGIPIVGAIGSSYAAGATGNYAVVVTNATGCFDTSNVISITILPSPSTAVTASGPVSFCAGSNITLSATSGTGYVYQWYNGVTPIPGATNMTYTTGAAGNYYVHIINGYGCAVNSIVTNIVVNPLPDVSITPAGPTVACAGSNVTLNAVSGGPYAYQWYKDGVAITGAVSSSYVASVSGGYRVRVTNTTTGCTALTGADTNVIIVATPSILALTPVKFCWGGSSLLSTSVSSAGSALNYVWYFNGSPIPGATSPTYSASAVGNYKCKVTVPGSCVSTTSEISVSQMPLPNPVIAYHGTSISTGTFYVTYQWYKNLIPIPGATAYSTVHTGTGNYKVRVTDTNGCQSVSDVYAITGGGTAGINSIDASHIKVYPNPAYTTVYIDSEIPLSAVLSSVDGREITRSSEAHTIDVSNLPNGIYMLLLYTDGVFVRAEKILKQ